MLQYVLDTSLLILFAGLNTIVCSAMTIIQLLVWAVWAVVTRHPARRKLLMVVVGGSVAMLLEFFDFPPLWELIDAHAIRHATSIPVTYLLWSFVRDDSEFRTSRFVKKME